MPHLTILCIEDEPEVRVAVLRDLEPFQTHFRIESVEDITEAREVIAECEAEGSPVALVLCDHLLPGEYGVDFLIELKANPDTQSVRRILLTGQAGHEDTIRAINEGGLHQYIAKPWEADQLVAIVRDQLTHYVLASEENPLDYVPILNGPRLLDAASRSLTDR